VAFLWITSGNKMEIFKLITMIGVSGYLVGVLKIIYKVFLNYILFLVT